MFIDCVIHFISSLIINSCLLLELSKLMGLSQSPSTLGDVVMREILEKDKDF